MPPVASFSYRVLFNFTVEHTVAEWWKDEGKDWSSGWIRSPIRTRN